MKVTFLFLATDENALAPKEKPPRKSSGLSRVEEVLTLKLYTVIEDFYSEETGNKFLKKGDKVEVLDTSRPDFGWLDACHVAQKSDLYDTRV